MNTKNYSSTAATNYKSELFESRESANFRFFSQGRPFSTENGLRVRPEFNRDVYNAWRPSEAVPEGRTQEEQQEIMVACRWAYERVGIIRSVIDLMSEYACEGICIEHPDEGPNNFYKAWQKKVQLEDRTERFLSWLYKSGNVAVRKKNGKVTLAGRTATLPLEYLFYNPANIDLVGGNAAALAGKKTYGIRMPMELWSDLRGIDPKYVAQIESTLPAEVLKNIQNPGSSSSKYFIIEIPTDKLYIAHYKKDDSDIWAKSFIYSILSDVRYNDKVKLAKTSAMDGIINMVRIWKIGSLDHNIFPSPAQFSRLATVLESNVGGGSLDLIWGPDLEMEEFYPPIDKLVNYGENLDPILLGLGVPKTLVGGLNETGGVSTTFSGLKNLIKRLEAGRREVVKWLESEIDIIQAEMKFSKRPFIRFNNSSLYDERTFLDLLVQLADRNILSDQTVLERIKEIPGMERVRLKEESDLRDSGELPDKASPFFNPSLEDQRDHEVKLKQMDIKSRELMATKPKLNNKGRPGGSKDKVKRTRGPKSFADLITYANQLYSFLEENITNHYLEENKAKDYRSLSSEAKAAIRNIVMQSMPHITPYLALEHESVAQALATPTGPIDLFTEATQHTGTNLTKDEEKLVCVTAYAKAWDEMGYIV